MTVRVDPLTGLPIIQPKVIVSGGGGGGSAGVRSVVAGTNVTVDSTDPYNPIVSASGGGGGSGTVDSVVAGNNIDVDATDPANPVVSVETLTLSDISDVTASVTEVNYTDGVTSAIQTQLDGKAASSHTHVESDITGLTTDLAAKVTANSSITGATKTKITYDAKGLVTAGADATTADIADSTNRRYVTDAQLTVIGNTSGTNTGDQDLSGYVPTTRTVNGHALSSNVTVTADDVLPSQTGNSGKFLTTNGTASSWGTPGGSGDMLASTYDPAGIAQQLVGTTASQTLTNKTISGSSNTLSNIGNSSLTNSAITIAGTSTSLGGSITRDTITGLSSTGIVKRTGANTLAIATSGTDYITPTGSETMTNKTLTTPLLDTPQISSTGGVFSGSTTGTTTVKASASASGTLTLPAATDTLVGKATTDTFSNKTIDTASTNTIKINGNALSASSGTATVTIPNSTDTLVNLTGSQTLTNKTFDSTSPTAFFFPGMIMSYLARTAPSGWLNADGSAVSRTTYANLFAAIAPSLGTFTVTIASPAVVTKTAHGLSTGDQVYLTTSGALPTGLSANTLYYIIRVDGNSFNIASSRANAIAGTKINTSGSQSGTHTVWDCPYGLGDGSTTFTLPDLRGRVAAGMDTTSGTAALRLTNPTTTTVNGVYGNLGASGGFETHQLTVAQLANHKHSVFKAGSAGGDGSGLAWSSTSTSNSAHENGGTGSDGSHNNIQPTQLVNYIIKT